MEERARELYAQVQDPRIPDRFRRPEEFGFTSSQRRLAESGALGLEAMAATRRDPAAEGEAIGAAASATGAAGALGATGDAGASQDPARRRAALMYRTTSSDYGHFDPSILEMPSQWNGKRDDMVRMQNYTVYRSDGLNTALDKGRYID